MTDPKRIYLAGKIGKDDWRHEAVRGLRDAMQGSCPPDASNKPWPVLQRAIFNRFDYVGPFFTSCDHGCWHGKSSHGNDVTPSGHYQDTDGRDRILMDCRAAISRADLVFVWLDSMDAYGTIAEIGFADALSMLRGASGAEALPDIFIASPPGFDPSGEMWFASRMASGGGIITKSPHNALRNYLIECGWFFDSPLEREFWNAWICNPSNDDLPLEMQHEVLSGRYRLDFAHLASKTAIEVDGFAYHSDRRQFERDRKRDRELSEAGWRTIRFASQELTKDVNKCAEQAARMIQAAIR